MRRPFPSLGIGWILAAIVFVIALGTALGLIAGGHLLWWLIVLLALALLI